MQGADFKLYMAIGFCVLALLVGLADWLGIDVLWSSAPPPDNE